MTSMNDITKAQQQNLQKLSKPKVKRPFTMNYKTFVGERGGPAQWQFAFQSRLGLDEARKILGSNSPRAILEVPLDCMDWNVVKIAYRKLVMMYHPDTGSSTANPEKFMKVQSAYEILEEHLNKEKK